jgi:hypothetical protein
VLSQINAARGEGGMQVDEESEESSEEDEVLNPLAQYQKFHLVDVGALG